MRTKPDHNSVVAKSNSIIDKLAKFELSELRLIAYCLAHYDSRTEQNRTFTATTSDLKKIFPINEKSAYRVIRKTVLSLAKKPAEFTEGKTIKLYHWFSGMEYQTDTGTFTFRVSSEMQPYLLGLKGTFTRYRLKDVYQFRAASTWKLYENVKRYEAIRSWSVELDELKLLLGVAGKYPKWYEFQRRIIAPAVDEINKQSDLEVSWEKEKRGRRVVGIVFFIDQRQPDDVINIENPKEALLKSLLDYGVHGKSTKDYVVKLDRLGRTTDALKRLPKIKSSWEKAGRPCSLQQYVLGAIRNEFIQKKLFDDEPEGGPNHKEALECWLGFQKSGKPCKVRERGSPGQRTKCRMCFDKMPIDEFGL